jgi:hypothetical protein
MITCTDFIPAYSELFKFLHKRGGKRAVEKYWNYLSDKYLINLKKLVKKHGLKGCWLYWNGTLNEEAADFTMELNGAEGFFSIKMHKCPSKSRLMKAKHIKPYSDYCCHCNVLYRRVLERLGYEYTFDSSQCHKAACAIVVRKNKKKT